MVFAMRQVWCGGMDKRFDDIVVPLTNPGDARFVSVDPLVLSGGNMKGFALLHLYDVMDTIAPTLAEEWRAQLPEPVRGKVDRRAFTSASWMPVEYYFHGVGWLAGRLGAQPRGALDLGFQIASRDIGAFFRFVMSMASPATVLTLSGRFWRSYFDQSSMQSTLVGDNGAVCEVRDWPLRDDVSPHEMAGSLVAWIEASRAEEVRITKLEVTGPGHFTFGVRWR